MPELMKSENGEEHGLVNTLANSCADNGFASMKPEIKAKAEKLRKEESRVVKARYINHRGKNERLDKPYCRYAGDPIQIFHLIPDNVYELPLGFINEVNSVRLAQRSEVLDKDGIPTKKDGKGLQIHELVPVAF